jgi:hypothetical protein
MTIKPGSRQTERSANRVSLRPDESLQAIEPSSATLRRIWQAPAERSDNPRRLNPHNAAAATNIAPASGHRTASLPCSMKLGPKSRDKPDITNPIAGMALVISVSAAAREERPTSI